ncbi:MAG: hypothetical protein NTV77_01895 [Candidatus Azambacteria bacterium]|nr:hypothetical protein [Candidatus Azambacteria bacterium]
MKNFLKNLNPTIRNFLIVGLLIILVFVGYGFYQSAGVSNNNQRGNVASEAINVDKLVKDAKVLYLEITLSAIEDVGDANFTSFFKEKINPKCPVYIPDGATYRECLFNWEDGLLKVFKGSKTNLDNIRNYCEGIGSKYPGSLLEGDLFLSCMIYKLSPRLESVK